MRHSVPLIQCFKCFQLHVLLIAYITYIGKKLINASHMYVCLFTYTTRKGIPPPSGSSLEASNTFALCVV